MAGYFSADRQAALSSLSSAMSSEGKMAEYRKGVDAHQKEPSSTKAGEEKGSLSAKKHFGKSGGKKSSRKSSRK